MKLTPAELDLTLARGGLSLEEPYHQNGSYRKNDWLLTRCIHCGTKAHYRLAYIQEKNGIGEIVCRACYWRAWYHYTGALYDSQVQKLLDSGVTREKLIAEGVISTPHERTWDEAEKLSEQNGFQLIDLIHCGRPGDDVLVVKCNACGRQSAMRPADVQYGCTCQRRRK